MLPWTNCTDTELGHKELLLCLPSIQARSTCLSLAAADAWSLWDWHRGRATRSSVRCHHWHRILLAHHVSSQWYLPPVSVPSWNMGKKKKNAAAKENSAIRVNYPGRKTVPRWPVTRGEIIQTKGTEESADQREAHDAVQIFPARPRITHPGPGRLFRLRPQHQETPGVYLRDWHLPKDLLTGENVSLLLLRANDTDAEERGE